MQILCLAEQIQFTEGCEAAIQHGSLTEFQIELEGQLQGYTSADFRSGQDSSDVLVLELKLKSLILDTVHNVDIVHQLLKGELRNVGDWLWQKQLRFYSDKSKGTCKFILLLTLERNNR